MLSLTHGKPQSPPSITLTMQGRPARRLSTGVRQPAWLCVDVPAAIHIEAADPSECVQGSTCCLLAGGQRANGRRRGAAGSRVQRDGISNFRSPGIPFYVTLQGSSCALAVNGHAAGGVAPPDVEFNEMAEPPAATAARHAARYFDNVHPVSAWLYGDFDLDCTPSQRVTPPPVFFFVHCACHRNSLHPV